MKKALLLFLFLGLILFVEYYAHLIIAWLVTITILFFIPVLIQLIAGYKALSGRIKMKYWKICSTSIISQLIWMIFLFGIITDNINKTGISDGFQPSDIICFGLFMIVIILIIICIQLFIHKKNKG